MKNETILLLAGGGLLAWYFWKHQQPAQPGLAVVPQQGTLPLPVDLLGIPQTVTPNLANSATGQAVAIPVPGANIASATGQNPNATIAQEQTIFNWIKWMKASDQAAFFGAWPQMTASEVSNLLAWASGQAGGQAWDQWRMKYSIDI